MKNDGIKKLYFSIGEVSKITDLEAHVLRYWETEFDQLRPKKNRAGNRIYTERDLKLLLTIKRLLKDEKYTIEGARQVLEREAGADAPLNQPARELLELRAFLQELLRKM